MYLFNALEILDHPTLHYNTVFGTEQYQHFPQGKMYYFPGMNRHACHDGRRAEPARFVPSNQDNCAQIYPRPAPEVMTARNRLWDDILRHPNPTEAIEQCMKLLTDDVEDMYRPRNEAEEEQSVRKQGQQGEDVVGPEAR